MKKLILLAFLGLPLLGNSQIIDIPNFNFKNALINTECASVPGGNIINFSRDVDLNNDGEISVFEAEQVAGLYLKGKNISNITGIEYFTQLEALYLDDNLISEFNYAIPDLRILHLPNNELTSLDLSIYPKLEGIDFDDNEISTINFSNNPELISISCQSNQLASLDISGLPQLERLYCSNNEIPNLYISPDQDKFTNIHCRNNQLNQLSIPALPELSQFSCDNNGMTWLSMNFDLPKLYYFSCENNKLTDLYLTAYTNLEFLWCQNNLLSSLDLSNLVELRSVRARFNQITQVNAQDCGALETLDCRDNMLTTVLMKNGAAESVQLEGNWSSEPIYICTDEFQQDEVQAIADAANLNVNINTFCSFVPGGIYYPVNGQNRVDLDGNGCDNNDPYFPNLKFKIDDGSNSSEFIANETGVYSLPFTEGDFSITPVLDNPAIFSIDPAFFPVSFSGPTFPIIQDYCLTPIGNFHDLDISIIPKSVARPGFTAKYQIQYSNRGNRVEDGSLSFSYSSALMELLYSSENPDSQAPGSLIYTFENISPGESRQINLQFKINSPAQSPPVNVGDLLNYEASVSTTNADDDLSNNDYQLLQSVVGSYDPNDKTCLTGDIITPDLIGEYIDYLIRFENTGNYAAENVVITDAIDVSKFDISTLRMTDASHEVCVRIHEGNQVEFVFENIQLPFDDDNNDGFVAFQIKTWPDLTIGDQLENTADIYFDFNLPITTNTTTSTIDYADADNDGYNSNDDCNDNDANINANQTEVPYNGIDEDCDPLTLDDDLDGDGFALADDCDDNDADINANQTEVPYNGIDEDCDPLTLDDDLDGDGFALADDCDDNDANINANQTEVPYNGIDEDCDPLTLDDDLDGDGFALADDCDDNDANINADQTEVPYNGIDEDCDPLTLDDDLDGDGFALADDCDDNDANINANQTEVPYNGIDEDCDPLTLDDDLDGDGYNLADDCDDDNAMVNSSMDEIPDNGIDDNCDGTVDELVNSIKQIDPATIHLYPNPTMGWLSLESDDPVRQVQVYNRLGMLMQVIEPIGTKIELSGLEPGLYFLKLEIAERSVIKRVVKL